MELHELHVDEVGARPQCKGVPVAGVLPGVRGDLVRLADATGREHDGGRREHNEPPRFTPIAERTRDPLAVLEQARDRALHEHVDLPRYRAVLQGSDHLEPGAITDVGETRVAVAAEVALEDPSIRCAIEERPPLLELQHPFRSLLRVDLRHAVVVQHLAAAHGVAEVDLPVVVLVHVAECGGNAAFGHHGVGLPSNDLQTRAVRASCRMASIAARSPAPPAPMTTTSYS